MKNTQIIAFWWPKLPCEKWGTCNRELACIKKCLRRGELHAIKNLQVIWTILQKIKNTQTRTYRCQKLLARHEERCFFPNCIYKRAVRHPEPSKTVLLISIKDFRRSIVLSTSEYRRRESCAVKSSQITLIGVVFDIGRQRQTQRDLTGSEWRLRRWVIPRLGLVAPVARVIQLHNLANR